jgi:hypothetical protein
MFPGTTDGADFGAADDGSSGFGQTADEGGFVREWWKK